MGRQFRFAGLAAVTALAFATACAASSRAVVLCDVHPRSGSPGACPKRDSIKHLHWASPGKATLSTRVFGVSCDALFSGDVQSGEKSDPQLAIEGDFSYSDCTGDCVFTEESLPVEIAIKAQAHETTALIPYALEHLNCAGFANCTFKERNLHGQYRSPNGSKSPNGGISFVKLSIRKESGALCLDKARFSIEATPLSKTYVTR